jgi:hypothetical protein
MAFTPNLIGKLFRPVARDIYGRGQFADPVDCQFAIVNAKRQSVKTSVRADSSASRGNADEITTGLGRILVAKHVEVEIGNLFEFDGDTYEIVSTHIRRSVLGEIDHFECDLEVRPR